MERNKAAAMQSLKFVHQSLMTFWRSMTFFTVYSFMILLSQKKFSSFFYIEKGAETKQQFCWLGSSSIKPSSSSQNRHRAPHHHGPHEGDEGENRHRAPNRHRALMSEPLPPDFCSLTFWWFCPLGICPASGWAWWPRSSSRTRRRSPPEAQLD